MALAECRVILNRSFREIKPHGTESFPCAGYFSFYLAGDIVPWHWHDEMEIIYINDGSLKLKVPSLSLYKMFEPEIGGEGPPSTMNDVRIKKMLGYIHENFPYDITLSDIASCVHVSERECIRCFQKTIHTSPIQYLLKYRIMCAADMLAGKPLESISWIAGECGFDSASNFSQTFKRFYNLTPREYRALYAARKSRIPPQDE